MWSFISKYTYYKIKTKILYVNKIIKLYTSSIYVVTWFEYKIERKIALRLYVLCSA